MNALQIIGLVAKGIGVVSTLMAAGKSAAPAWAALKTLAGHAEAGVVTEDVLIQTEAALDDLIDRFNEPI